jgi:hypothetical protein
MPEIESEVRINAGRTNEPPEYGREIVRLIDRRV